MGDTGTGTGIGWSFDAIKIITPGSIRRRIVTLDIAWNALEATSPKNKLLKADLLGWRKFRDSIMSDKLAQWTATGTSDEIDTWQQRYNKAYERISKDGPIDAPSPAQVADPLDEREGRSPWLYAAVGAAAGLIILATGIVWRGR